MAEVRLGSMVMEDAGEGPAVVMIHGLGGSSNTFETLMGGLTGYRVLRPDLPGAGRSAPKPGLDGLKGLAAAVWDLMRAARVERAHFVGHSMGTLLCQYLAVAHPDRVTGMTLYGAILEPPAAARDALRQRAAQVEAEGMAGVAEAVASGSISEGSRLDNPAAKAFVRESLMRQPRLGYAAHCRALSEARAADHGAISCPILLVAGETDPIAPVAMARALQEGIAGARLEILPGVAHWMTIEAPARAAELLQSNLKSAA